MIANPRVSVGPASEPVTLEEARLHVRADGTLDDASLTDAIKAAREFAEAVTGKRYVTQTLIYNLDAFPEWEIQLPEPPLASITSIKYYDEDNIQRTLASTKYRIVASRNAVEPEVDEEWPDVYDKGDSVEITYVVGTAASAVPFRIKRGILLLVGHWYANREEVIIGTTATQIPAGAEKLFRSDWTGEYV